MLVVWISVGHKLEFARRNLRVWFMIGFNDKRNSPIAAGIGVRNRRAAYRNSFMGNFDKHSVNVWFGPRKSSDGESSIDSFVIWTFCLPLSLIREITQEISRQYRHSLFSSDRGISSNPFRYGTLGHKNLVKWRIGGSWKNFAEIQQRMMKLILQPNVDHTCWFYDHIGTN